MVSNSKYDTEIDLSVQNNSHTLVTELVGREKLVLDVGASTGFLAKTLAAYGCRVTGIELDPEAARQAAEHCERVVVGDVESLDLSGELDGASFDVIVFGDTLEHLKDPLQTLERFKPFLRRGGFVVASIPNVAHGSVRLALLQGRFQYRPLGLLDDTHLHFFTRESVEQLFEDAGLRISELRRTRRGIFNTEVEVDRALVPGEVLETIQRDPEAQTYQFVLKARLAEESNNGAESTGRVHRHLEHAAPGALEEDYNRLTGYAFARRYVEGRSVADISREGIGPGTRLLAGAADSVTGLTDFPEAAERASALYPTPNANYKVADLPTLPHSDESFDVVVALQVIEHLESPEELVREAKRVLKPDGVLVISTPDKQAHSNERGYLPARGALYASEFRELLGRHFEHVSPRRQGTVGGGFISGASEELSRTPPESARFSSDDPSPGAGLPPTHLVLAVCGDAGALEDDGRPYLLLDTDRRVFEESEDQREDIELLRTEVRRMQQSEVQSFQHRLILRDNENTDLRSRLRELEAENRKLSNENQKTNNRLNSIEGSRIWQLFAPYRRLRLMLHDRRGSGS